MANITLTMPAPLIKKAKVLAAQRSTSVSGLVADLLEGVTGGESDWASAWADEVRFMAAGHLEAGPVTWTRDDLHQR